MNAKEIDSMLELLAGIVREYVDAKFAEALKAIPEIDVPLIADAAAKLIPTPEDGKPGEDGKSVSIEDIQPLIVEHIEKMVAQIPVPKNGEQGPPGERGEKGEDGKDADLDAVQKMVQDEVSSIEIVVPEPDHGRDALQIEIMPEIDAEKSYPRGTYATHKGGLWRSHEKTLGMRGWECIVNGISETRIESVDHRTFKIINVDSRGVESTHERQLPGMIYKGIFSPDNTYLAGDTVTFGGSLWVAKKDDPQGKPGQSQDWQLVVKKGRDGKSA